MVRLRSTRSSSSGPSPSSASRELRASTPVDAPAAVVWQALSDVAAHPAWSPELVRMVPLRPGGLRVGQVYLGINRRKGVVWPSRNVVSELEAGRRLAWDTRTSGARWVWEVAPDGDRTLVTLSRPVPRRLTLVGRVFAAAFLGGVDGHADELEAGMRTTLERFALAVTPRDPAGRG